MQLIANTKSINIQHSEHKHTQLLTKINIFTFYGMIRSKSEFEHFDLSSAVLVLPE